MAQIYLPRYVMARNASGRPTLQHEASGAHFTRCGVDISGWSRVWQTEVIPVLFCRRCKGTP